MYSGRSRYFARERYIEGARKRGHIGQPPIHRQSSGAVVSRSLPQYLTLVLLVLVLNYGFIYAYHTAAGSPLTLSKLLTEATIFVFSYWTPRKYLYQG